MGAKAIFSEAHKTYIRNGYLTAGLTATSITPMVNKKFGTTFTERQVQRLINARWSKKLKAKLAKADARMQVRDAQAANGLVKKTMEHFATRAAKGADKAFDMMDRATDARTMASAAAAAKSMVTTTRLCLGIDGVGSGGVSVTNFNFNFADVKPEKVGDAASEPALDVEAQQLDDDDDVGEGDDEIDDDDEEQSDAEASHQSAPAS